jgi:hypothetical protein
MFWITIDMVAEIEEVGGDDWSSGECCALSVSRKLGI